MKRFIEGEDRKQATLLPECLDDFIAEENPARIIDAFVEELDLESLGFEGANPSTTGRPSYHPAVLLRIYIYGYLNRIQSSRRLERECQRNIELMWLTGRLAPDFKTIADFRRDNGAGIRNVCRRFIAEDLVGAGGIRPAQRHRAARALTFAEREEISRSLALGLSIRAIASRLNRAPSTISRELERNGGRQSYRASQADALAWERARRPKLCKLVRNRVLAQVVAGKLRLQWSPEQIAGWLKHVYAVNKDYQVSHEAIYRSLHIQARGALKKELLEHLRRSRVMRRSRQYTMKTEGRTNNADAVSISERPATAEDRAIPWHWKGDLLFGDANSQIATLVERQSRFVMLVKTAGKDSEAVVNALIKHVRKLPQELYKSLTWDRGTEMAGHKRFTVATNIQVYFCDPQHPWQRGSNENMNGLLRQYFPKGTNLSAYSQAKLNAVARRLNERPRKTLNFDTPAERFHQYVESTG